LAGIYLHIPFCRKACHYCDFHFSTSLKLKDDLLEAMILEIEERKDYLSNEVIDTIYFGGGTPSVLTLNELGRLLNALADAHSILTKVELTLEANPDDLTTLKLKALKSLGINRLSIGVQSFRNEDLKLMNRLHSGEIAMESIENARSAGFQNLNIDLIYGIPGLSETAWEKNLEMLFSYKPEHISAYSLTIEERTAFGHRVKIGSLLPEKDEVVIRQFQQLMQMAKDRGYDHYEISNFSLPGLHSKHNTSYWLGKKYLGIGPSAHSYDGAKRRWNIRNNPLYIKYLRNKAPYFEEETLSEKDQFNEYLLTSLRTKWGIDLELIAKDFGGDVLMELEVELAAYLKDESLIKVGQKIYLSEKGKLVADKITSDLFSV
jgi:oxygen-independent coproporphyrinogen-3 oxidase